MDDFTMDREDSAPAWHGRHSSRRGEVRRAPMAAGAMACLAVVAALCMIPVDEPLHPAASTGRETDLRHAVPEDSFAFSHDGRRLARAELDGTVAIVDLTGASQRESRAFSQVQKVARCLAFSPDGSLLAAGFYDGKTGLWDLETHSLRVLFQAHFIAVRSVAFSPEGTVLATASAGLENQALGCVHGQAQDHHEGT